MALDDKLAITDRRDGNAVVVAPAGRIDMATAKQFEDHVIPLVVDAGTKREILVLDFSGVEYISSVGLRVLMLAAKESKKAGGRIAVAAMQPMVNEIFEISRFTKVLACHAGVDEAIAALESKS